MASESDTPLDLYIAAYADPDAAQADWDAIKGLAKDDTIKVDGLVLISRGSDGKIDVKDDFHTIGHAAAWGAGAGLLIGLIFPPAFLASGLVGAGVGAGIGGLVSHAEKSEIKDEVADDVPPGSSAIVALFEERWATDVAEGAAEGREGLEARGRQAERREGEGRGDQRLDTEPGEKGGARAALLTRNHSRSARSCRGKPRKGAAMKPSRTQNLIAVGAVLVFLATGCGSSGGSSTTTRAPHGRRGRAGSARRSRPGRPGPRRPPLPSRPIRRRAACNRPPATCRRQRRRSPPT